MSCAGLLQEPITKYAVVSLDCETAEIEIEHSFNDVRDALMYMTHRVDELEEFQDTATFRKIFDGQNCISIYRTNWTIGKTLIRRWFVVSYFDARGK